MNVVIGGFSSFLVVGLVSLYDPGSIDGYEEVVAVTGDDVDELVSAASEQDGLQTRYYEERADAHDAFERATVAAVLDSSLDSEGRLAVRVTAPDEGLGTTLLIVQVRELLETVERSERQANADQLAHDPLPVPPESSGETSPYFAFTYTILLPLLCFLPVFISGSIAVDSLIEERQRGTLELLRVAPPSLSDIVTAKLIGLAALAPVQAALWLALLAVNGTAITQPVAIVSLVAALSILLVTAGLAIALFSPDQRQAQLLFSGAVIGALIVTTVLPEHPANTIATFAVGSDTATTWVMLAAYCLLAVTAVLAFRYGVNRLDPDTL